MNLMQKIRTFSFSATALRVFGTLFMMSGLIGTMMQTQLLGTGTMTGEQLMEVMANDASVASSVAICLVFYCLEACAVPIFTFLLVEGATHTSHYGKYMARVLGLAVVCQLPYNMVTTGNLMVMSSLNPVFAMVMSMIMLYFFRRFTGKKFSHVMIKLLAVAGTFLWSNMLGISHGAICVLLTAVLWALRGRDNLQTWVGMILCFAACIFSLFYIAAPLSFLILHFYEGEQGSNNRIVNYGAYPVLLVAFGLMIAIM